MTRRLREDIAFLSLVQGANVAIPLLTLPYLARVLKTDAFGAYALCFALLQYVVLISEYGFNLSGIRSVTIIKEDRRLLSETFWAIMLCKCFLLIVAFALLMLTVSLTGYFSNLDAELLLGSLFLGGTVLYPQWMLQGMGMTREIAIASVTGKLTLLPLFFLFVRSPADLDIAVSVYGISTLITAGIGLYSLINRQILICVRPKLSRAIDELKAGGYIFASSVATNIYSSSVVVFLGAVSGGAEVGIFSVADKIRQAIQMFFAPLQQALYPKMSEAMSKDASVAEDLVKRLLKILVGIGLVIAVVQCLTSRWVITWLFGSDYVPASIVLNIFSPVPLLTAVSGLLGIQVLTAAHRQKSVFLAIFLGALVCLGLIYPFCKFFGANGAAWTILLSELTITCVIWLKVKTQFPKLIW